MKQALIFGSSWSASGSKSGVFPRKYQQFSRVHRSALGAPLDRQESTLGSRQRPDIENYGKRLASCRVLNRRFRGEGSGERVGKLSEHRPGPDRARRETVEGPGGDFVSQTSIFIVRKFSAFIWSYKNRGLSFCASQSRSRCLFEK